MKTKVKQVVGTAFINDGKILVVQSIRSINQGQYTLIGGMVEDEETNVQAAIREIKEEIGNSFEVEEKDLREVLSFIEPADSDPNLLIQIHIYVSNKKVDVELKPNFEILEHKWYSLNEDDNCLSSSLKNYLIPYAKETGLL